MGSSVQHAVSSLAKRTWRMAEAPGKTSSGLSERFPMSPKARRVAVAVFIISSIIIWACSTLARV